MRFDIITIFPKIFDSYFNESILGRAQKKKLVTIDAHDMRKFSCDKHKKARPTGRWSYGRVDDKPYGGGAGMVLAAEPILRAVEAVLKKNLKHEIPALPAGRRNPKQTQNSKLKLKTKIIILSAKGKQLTQKIAYDWTKKYDQLVLISGRYEGIDERVFQALKYVTRNDNIFSYSKKYYHSISVDEISIGPYVLTDGDAAAMVIISAVARLILGVIKLESLAEESHWNALLKSEKNVEKGGVLEYPHYTRPEIFEWKGRKYRVPKILLSGDHKKIQRYRESKRKKAR